MSLRTSLSLTCALLATAPLRAGDVSGRVLKGAVPLVGADLDFDPVSGGGGVTESGDFTDAQGYFSATITPNNLYDMIVLPPPGSDALVQVVPNVSIGALPTALGTIVVPTGVMLSGRCVNAAGVGVAGVNLDVIDSAGHDVRLAHDTTNALGYFNVAVPAGDIELRFNTSPVVGTLLAPRSIALAGNAPHALGDVVLQPGFVLSALVRRQANNLPVADVDVDVLDAASGALLYTPGDNSDAAGYVDVVVPAGTYNVRFEAPFALRLVGVELDDRVVAANTGLGTLLLQSGFVLSGLVTAADGSVHAGVDVDVKDALTGVGVYLGHDNTNGAGTYQVIVPPGTFEVVFSPPLSLPLAAARYANVLVAANKVQSGVLPLCPFFTNVGGGIAGLGGLVPQISSSGGAPRVGNLAYVAELSQARGGSKGIVVYSLNPLPNPLPNPGAPLSPMQRRVVLVNGPLGVAGAGSASFALPIPDDPALAGSLLRAWFLVRDSAGPNGLSKSDELRATICL